MKQLAIIIILLVALAPSSINAADPQQPQPRAQQSKPSSTLTPLPLSRHAILARSRAIEYEHVKALNASSSHDDPMISSLDPTPETSARVIAEVNRVQSHLVDEHLIHLPRMMTRVKQAYAARLAKESERVKEEEEREATAANEAYQTGESSSSSSSASSSASASSAHQKKRVGEIRLRPGQRLAEQLHIPTTEELRAKLNGQVFEEPDPNGFLNAAVDNPPRVKIQGKQLFVDGQPFQIRGVCYSPVPIGESVNFAPFGDYFTVKYMYMWKRDLALIKQMGANTIRIYGWDPKADHYPFLDECQKVGLKVLVTYYLGLATENPVNTADERWSLIGRFVEQLAWYGDHPAILMWSFGNELNGPWNYFTTQFSWNFGCGWTGYCLNNRDPNSECVWRAACMYTALFTWINDAARSAKYVTSRPIISGFADIDYFIGAPWPDYRQDKVPLFEHLLPDMGAWAMQLYRGRSFGGYFGNFNAESGKPLVVTEYGIDAYNDPCGWAENMGTPQTCFNLPMDGWGGSYPASWGFSGCNNQWADCSKPGVQTQADWDAGLTIELMNNGPDKGGPVIGGFLMAWTDEYWKGSVVQDQCAHPCPSKDISVCLNQNRWGYVLGGWASCGPHAHFTCGNWDTTFHDLCGYALYAFPDGYVNEEWFGITEPRACEIPDATVQPASGEPIPRLDALTLRPVYYAIKNIWGGTPPPPSPGHNQTDFLQPLTCDQLKPCHACLRKYSAEDIKSGWCEEFCNPDYVAPTFWDMYATPLYAGAAIVSLSTLTASAIYLARRPKSLPSDSDEQDTLPLFQSRATASLTAAAPAASSSAAAAAAGGAAGTGFAPIYSSLAQ